MNKIFDRALLMGAILSASVLTGCASIVNGSNQVLSVETRNNGEMLSGATCRLENPKGVFYVTTPGTVTIHRAYDDLNVKCEKNANEPGIATVKSNTKPMAFGNILFGGVIGAAVDAGTGAAYDYPSLITVMMGQVITITSPEPPTPQPGSPAPAQAAEATKTVFKEASK